MDFLRLFRSKTLLFSVSLWNAGNKTSNHCLKTPKFNTFHINKSFCVFCWKSSSSPISMHGVQKSKQSRTISHLFEIHRVICIRRDDKWPSMVVCASETSSSLCIVQFSLVYTLACAFVVFMLILREICFDYIVCLPNTWTKSDKNKSQDIKAKSASGSRSRSRSSSSSNETSMSWDVLDQVHWLWAALNVSC